MGRFYNGDISGKWAFAVQSSETPKRFGGEETTIEYGICNNDAFQEAMKKIKTSLGESIKIFDEFFAKKSSYNNEKLVEFFQEKGTNYTDNISMVDIEYLLPNYVDYQFGLKVAKYFEESGEEYCSIVSELY